MELLIRLLLAHLLGDFSFQSYTLATMKREGWKGLIIHSSLLTLITALMTIGASPWWWAITLIVGFAHFALDTTRSSIPPGKPLQDFGYFLGDQAVHLAFILLVTVAFEGSIPRWTYSSPQEIPLRIRLMVIGIAFILVIWVIPLWEMYILNLLPRCASSHPRNKVDLTQRIVGSIERLLAILLFVRISPLAAFLPFIPRLFLKDELRCTSVRVGVSLALTLPVVLLLLTISSG